MPANVCPPSVLPEVVLRLVTRRCGESAREPTTCSTLLQVQKVLKNLTIEGGLKEDHLDLLWNLTEKVRDAACMLRLAHHHPH